jgi:hypothetical protein
MSFCPHAEQILSTLPTLQKRFMTHDLKHRALQWAQQGTTNSRESVHDGKTHNKSVMGVQLHFWHFNLNERDLDTKRY